MKISTHSVQIPGSPGASTVPRMCTEKISGPSLHCWGSFTNPHIPMYGPFPFIVNRFHLILHSWGSTLKALHESPRPDIQEAALQAVAAS